MTLRLLVVGWNRNLKLLSLPDAKFCVAGWFTVGKDYPVVRELGNCFVVQADNGEMGIVLKERFSLPGGSGK